MSQFTDVPNLEIFLLGLSETLNKSECENIRDITRVKYCSLLEAYNLPAEKALRFHLEQYIFSGVALYQTILESGYEKAAALSLVNQSVEAWAQKPKKAMKIFSKIPFYYPMMRVSVSKMIGLGFPAKGWDVEWLEN